MYKRQELCCRAIDEMVDVLGKGIANICYVLNPEVVVDVYKRQLFILCIPSITRKKAGRLQGLLLLGSYILYLAVLAA